MFLLDTCVVSELRKAGHGRADPNVAEWARTKLPDELHISAVTVQELEWGVLLMERRDAEQGLRLRRWLHGQVLPAFRDRILPIDASVALRTGQLHVPDKRPERDALIAATASRFGCAVVTRNTSDFQNAGVEVLNPWIP